MDTTVRRLHTDLQHLRQATASEKKDTAALKTHNTAEKAAQAKIAKQEKAIIDQFTSSPPTDPAATTKALNQLFDLGKQSATSKAKFDALEKKDQQHIKGDKKAEKNDHKKALKDLKPAEYHMGLKSTNNARKELGLKKLDKPLRQEASSKAGKAITEAKKYLGRYESDLQRHGITQHCPTSESCANFVTSMLHKTGAINFRTLGVSDLNNRLRSAGWHQVSLKDAKPGDVWICNGAHGESHTELVASNKNGHVTLIGSNNHPQPGNQQINYDTYSANISGSFILAPRK